MNILQIGSRKFLNCDHVLTFEREMRPTKWDNLPDPRWEGRGDAPLVKTAIQHQLVVHLTLITGEKVAVEDVNYVKQFLKFMPKDLHL